eukprot:10991245-Karenia_brevis.AAC.1
MVYILTALSKDFNSQELDAKYFLENARNLEESNSQELANTCMSTVDMMPKASPSPFDQSVDDTALLENLNSQERANSHISMQPY